MAIQDVTNYSDFLFKTGIGNNNFQVEQYARANDMSYEEAAVQLYRQGRVGTQSPEFSQMITSHTPGTFFFDFAAEAEKAFGELGAYYDRLLRESKGDTTRAIARLSEDYETGTRIQKIKEEKQNRALLHSGLERGITSMSAYGPQGGDGANLNTPENLNSELGIFGRERQELSDVQKLESDIALRSKKRAVEDITISQEREEKELEERRKKEAAELANTRAERAYQSYTANLM